MPKNTLENLFSPKSIAIIGASTKKGKIGTVLVENITKLGYKGSVYFVNPSYNFLKLKRCYHELSDIKKEVDVAIVAVPAKFVAEVIAKSKDRVKNFVVISAGFSETGGAGIKREKELALLSHKYDVNILGPNCLGYIVPGLKLNASFAGGMPKAGNIAFVSQSGALAVALMDKAEGEHIGFSQIVSVGNKMQIDESALLEYLASDKETKVIGMYLEGIKDGQRFIKIARKVSKIKPIVILKAGKTEKAQKAISSHTGALAGSDDIIDVAFEKAGVIRANDLGEFFDLLTLISFVDAPKNEKVAVITNAGGAGVLTTDAFKNKEVVLVDFAKKIKNQMKAVLPAEGSVENPIDLLGDAQEDRYQSVLDILSKQKLGSIVSILTPQQQTPVEKITQVIVTNKRSTDSAMLTVFIGGGRTEKSVDELKKNAIPNFPNPDSAILALNKYYRWNIYKKEKLQSVEKLNSPLRHKQVQKMISAARAQKRGALYFSEAALAMSKYDINAVEYYEIGGESSDVPLVNFYPVVIKVDSDKVLHKSDKEALLLNIQNELELKTAIEKLRINFPTERLLIQPMQNKQIEIILGIKQDSIFGPVIVYGLGGIYTEIFKMINFLIPPMSREAITDQIMKSKIGFLFLGARGQKKYDIHEFVNIIEGLMAFAIENKNILEFDINPLFLYNDGRRACSVDIKIII
jgi:acetyltransferase